MIPLHVVRILPFVPLIAVLAACHSTARKPERVDTALLQYLDEDGRTAVAEARRLRDEAGDALAAARLDVEKAKADLAVANQQRDVAVARLQRAQTGSSTPVRAEDASASDRAIVSGRVDPVVEDARFGIASADDRIGWHKCSVEVRERQVDMLEARRELAEAKVHQAQTAALLRAGRPEVDAVSMHEVDRTVRRCELEIKVAEIRLTGAEEEAALAKSRADEPIETRRERATEERGAVRRGSGA